MWHVIFHHRLFFLFIHSFIRPTSMSFVFWSFFLHIFRFIFNFHSSGNSSQNSFHVSSSSYRYTGLLLDGVVAWLDSASEIKLLLLLVSSSSVSSSSKSRSFSARCMISSHSLCKSKQSILVLLVSQSGEEDDAVEINNGGLIKQHRFVEEDPPLLLLVLMMVLCKEVVTATGMVVLIVIMLQYLNSWETVLMIVLCCRSFCGPWTCNFVRDSVFWFCCCQLQFCFCGLAPMCCMSGYSLCSVQNDVGMTVSITWKGEIDIYPFNEWMTELEFEFLRIWFFWITSMLLLGGVRFSPVCSASTICHHFIDKTQQRRPTHNHPKSDEIITKTNGASTKENEEKGKFETIKIK